MKSAPHGKMSSPKAAPIKGGMHKMDGHMMKDSDMPKGMGPKMMNKPGAKKK